MFPPDFQRYALILTGAVLALLTTSALCKAFKLGLHAISMQLSALG